MNDTQMDRSDCLEICKYGRDLDAKKGGTLLRCMLCSRWYHAICVGVPEDETAGAWTCPNCREIFFGISILHREVFTLTNMSENILQEIKTYRRAVASKEEQDSAMLDILSRKDDEIANLNNLLRSTRDSLNSEVEEAMNAKRTVEERDEEIASLKTALIILKSEATSDPACTQENTNSTTSSVTGVRPIYLSPTSSNFASITQGPGVPQRPLYSSIVQAAKPQTKSPVPKPNPGARIFYPSNSNLPKDRSVGRPTRHQTANNWDAPSSEIAIGAQNRKAPRLRVQGTNNVLSQLSHGLRAAPRVIAFRLSYLSMDTTTESLGDFIIREIRILDSTVEEIIPPSHVTHPSYKCFKIAIPQEERDLLLKPDLWPQNVVITQYRSPRNQPATGT